MKEVDVCEMCGGVGWYPINDKYCLCSCSFYKGDDTDMDDDSDDGDDNNFNPFQQGGLGIITRV